MAPVVHSRVAKRVSVHEPGYRIHPSRRPKRETKSLQQGSASAETSVRLALQTSAQLHVQALSRIRVRCKERLAGRWAVRCPHWTSLHQANKMSDDPTTTWAAPTCSGVPAILTRLQISISVLTQTKVDFCFSIQFSSWLTRFVGWCVG